MRDYAGLQTALFRDLGIDPGSVEDRHFYSDDSPTTVARYQLASSFYKKLCPTGTNREADRAALIKFKAVNDQLPAGPWSFLAANEAEATCYSYFKEYFAEALWPREGHVFDYAFIADRMGIGPGSAQKADSDCEFTKLFESPMSYVNPDSIRHYRTALSGSGLYADAEMQRWQRYGFERVKGGKLFFAAKNAAISRTCCTEANLEMLLQKAVGSYFEDRLLSDFGISLSTQADKNRVLARMGSEDDSIATIDLTSASDCNGLYLLDSITPNCFLKAVMFGCSSRRAILPDGSTVELNMISTMGNGFTFPLQTLLFACMVKAVYHVMGIPMARKPGHRTPFAVFGDDIIVVKEAYSFTCRMLEGIGFQVNGDKSFYTGHFRESCGHDYFKGKNVRGVYVKSLESPQQVYSLINRLSRWSAFHGVSLTGTLKLLCSWVRDVRVPPSESDDAGIHVPFRLTKPSLDERYWFKYRYYSRKVKRRSLASKKDEVEQDGATNWLGVACCFISGSIRRREVVFCEPNDSVWKTDWSLSVSIRDRVGARPRYKIASTSIPWWDYRLPNIPKNVRKTSLQSPMERHAGNGVSYDTWAGVVAAYIE